jgi:hypothetical protein
MKPNKTEQVTQSLRNEAFSLLPQYPLPDEPKRWECIHCGAHLTNFQWDWAIFDNHGCPECGEFGFDERR